MKIQDGDMCDDEIQSWLEDNPHEELEIETQGYYIYYPALPEL